MGWAAFVIAAACTSGMLGGFFWPAASISLLRALPCYAGGRQPLEEYSLKEGVLVQPWQAGEHGPAYCRSVLIAVNKLACLSPNLWHEASCLHY